MKYRLFFILFALMALGNDVAKADTIIISGVLLEANGARAAGYTCKAYSSNPRIADITTNYGIYSIYKYEVSRASVKYYQIVCEGNGKEARSGVNFTEVSSGVWQAKLEDLILTSAQARYTRTEATRNILVGTEVLAIKAKSGEITYEEANKLAAEKAARILSLTNLGENPEATLQQINKALIRNYDPNLYKLPILEEKNFMNLKSRPDFNNPGFQKPVFKTKPLKPNN